MHKRKGRAARDGRRNDAAIRQAERDGITDERQLAELMSRGHGHCREAARLLLRINRAAAARKKGDKDAEGND